MEAWIVLQLDEIGDIDSDNYAVLKLNGKTSGIFPVYKTYKEAVEKYPYAAICSFKIEHFEEKNA